MYLVYKTSIAFKYQDCSNDAGDNKNSKTGEGEVGFRKGNPPHIHHTPTHPMHGLRKVTTSCWRHYRVMYYRGFPPFRVRVHPGLNIVTVLVLEGRPNRSLYCRP